MKSFSVRLPDELYNKIRDMAEKERRSLSSQITVILEQEASQYAAALAGNTQTDPALLGGR